MIRIYVEAISKKLKIAIILAIALLTYTVALQSASVRCAAESENGITLIQIGFEKEKKATGWEAEFVMQRRHIREITV